MIGPPISAMIGVSRPLFTGLGEFACQRRIWFLAACSLSDVDRRSGGPSVPTLTRPDIFPGAEENVKGDDPRPSASKRIVSKLHTPVAPGSRLVDAVPATTCAANSPLRLRAS